jgi:hypothetical protein
MTDDQARLLRRVNMALSNGGGTHDFYTDVMPLLQTGKAQWFQHGMGVAVTELRDHPRLREVNVWLVAGRLADCLELQEPIEAWARRVGAHRIVGVGRSGWARVGRSMGLTPTGVRLEKWLAEPVT